VLATKEIWLEVKAAIISTSICQRHTQF
jgi:hypothetical protein